MAGAGVRAILLPRLLPTPVLAFAVRHLDVGAGVMVTASHNPANDNGYKVYLGGLDHGSQIVPPVDGLHRRRDRTRGRGRTRGRPAALEGLRDRRRQRGRGLREGHRRARRRRAQAARRSPTRRCTASGGRPRSACSRPAGFDEPHVVKEQLEPDPTFPTVAFPNPEEPGAMDLVLAAAEAAGADLAIANDPDADRLAVGIPTEAMDGAGSPATRSARSSAGGPQSAPSTGGMTPAPSPRHWSRRPHSRRSRASTTSTSRTPSPASSGSRASAASPTATRRRSATSSTREGARQGRHLRGARHARARGRAQGRRAARWTTTSSTFAEKFGAYASAQISMRVDDLSEITQHDAEPARAPARRGRRRAGRADRRLPRRLRAVPAQRHPAHLGRGRRRIVVRPSGTEPKLKAYIDASSTDGTGPERIAAAEQAVATLERGMRALLGA